MNRVPKTAYIKEFKAYMREINSSALKTKAFYNKAGITTASGKLTKRYSHIPSPKTSN